VSSAQTCEGCKWKEPLHDNEYLCGNPDLRAMIYTHPDTASVRIAVTPDFGCNQWKSKESNDD